MEQALPVILFIILAISCFALFESRLYSAVRDSRVSTFNVMIAYLAAIITHELWGVVFNLLGW